MAGLLDMLGSSLEDPKTQATFAAIQGLLSGPRALPAISNGLMNYGQSMQQAKQQAAAEEMRKMQLAQHALQYQEALKASQQADMDRKLTQQAFTAVKPIEANQASGITGPRPEALGVVGQLPKFDAAQFIGSGGSAPLAFQLEQSMRKDTSPIKLSAGDALYDPKTFKPVASNPKDDSPSALKEYQYAVTHDGYKGTFQQFRLEEKRAGAPSTTVKVENKTGESLAGQVGPMAKDSRIQTQGAVKMFDAADRLDQALQSNLVTSGPMASKIQTVKQLVQVIGGGNDDSIRQTRQAIKSLAQMSVEARKQLQGQGQVTENEAAAVAKADAGDINDLTPGELKDLVTLTKRAAHFQAKSHQDLISTLGSRDETKGLVPFYNVQGLEPLLSHTPELPKIGVVRRYNPQTGKLE